MKCYTAQIGLRLYLYICARHTAAFCEPDESGLSRLIAPSRASRVALPMQPYFASALIQSKEYFPCKICKDGFA